MKKIFFPAVLIAFTTAFVFGQSISVSPIITEADIINASVLVDPLAEKIKDIAPSTFSLHILNMTNPRVPVMATMEFEAHVTLEEDRQRTAMFLAPAKTKRPFLISENGRVFTSKDADNPSSDIALEHSVNNELKKKLKDKILEPTSGGRAPSGLYEIRILVTVVKVGDRDTLETPIEIYRSINVTNPTTTVLDVPFENGYVYPTPFPQFQWTYDTRSIQLSIYELRREHQSLEDAIGASDPFLQIRVDRKLSGNLSSFTYPQSAASRPGVEFVRGPRQLERGKMYVVVLDGITTAFGYDVEPLRTIRSFRISDPQGQVVVNILQTTFGGGEFQNVFNLIQDMNLQLTTTGITLNGVALSPQDLQKLLIENKDRIISVRFED